jgi:MFS family permease
MSTESEGWATGALVILLAGQAMATMDGAILAITAPSLRTSLHASGAELQLVVAAYTMAFAALVVTGARLGDILGGRRIFVHGLAASCRSENAEVIAPSNSKHQRVLTTKRKSIWRA